MRAGNVRSGMALQGVLIFALLATVFMVVMLQFTGIFGKMQRQVSASDSITLVSQNFLADLSNPKAWASTLAHNGNLSNCLGVPASPCGGSGSFLLYDASNQLFYDGTQGTSGFSESGKPCNTFDSVNGNDLCPYHLSLTWSPVVGCVNLAQVVGQFSYQPASPARRVAFNATLYEFSIVMSDGGPSLLLGSACHATKQAIPVACNSAANVCDFPATPDLVTLTLFQPTTVSIDYSAKSSVTGSTIPTDCYSVIVVDGTRANLVGGGSQSHWWDVVVPLYDVTMTDHLHFMTTVIPGTHTISVQHAYNNAPATCQWANRVLYVMKTFD